MDDKTSLIEQLRIERPAEAEPANWPKWVAIGVALVAIAAVATWILLPRGVAVRAATVELAPAEAAAGPGTILDASGYVVARRQATVSSKITGKVVQVSIEEGKRVARDEIIARLDDTNARAALDQARAARAQAEANLTAAQVAFDNAGPTFRRNEQQLAKEVISAQTFDTAKAAYDAARTGLDVAKRGLEVARSAVTFAERNLDDTIVRAPFAGIVTVKAAQEGEMVSPISAGGGFTRTGIGTIVDMDSLEVEVDVSENFINRVHGDQAVTARLNAYPDWAIPGHVIAIIPTADRAKATVKVRVGFDARDDRILPEMGVRVAFLDTPSSGSTETSSAGGTQRAFLVPADAVQASGDTGVVFVLNEDRAERRAVKLGARVAGKQIVLSGLTAGARVATGDLSQLADGTKVRVAD